MNIVYPIPFAGLVIIGILMLFDRFVKVTQKAEIKRLRKVLQPIVDRIDTAKLSWAFPSIKEWKEEKDALVKLKEGSGPKPEDLKSKIN